MIKKIYFVFTLSSLATRAVSSKEIRATDAYQFQKQVKADILEGHKLDKNW